MDGAIKEKITPISIAAPVNLKDNKEYSFYCTEALTYSIIVYEHQNVFVSASGVCFNMLGQLLPGSFMHLKRVKTDQKKIAFFNLLLRKKKELDHEKKYLVIHNQWSINGYYHWIIDSMPRLWSVRDSLSQVCLLLPESTKQNQFIQGTLSFFPGLEIEYLERGKVAHARNLVLPSHLPYWGILEPRFLHEFRDFILGQTSKGNAKNFVYISRKKASRRKIANEEEVVDVLNAFGFRTVLLENHSFEEQVKIFNSASIVVSIHGAGLTNLLFMNEGASVLEIIKMPVNDEKYLMEYQRLASIFKIKFYSLPSRAIDRNASFDAADLYVDVNELQENVASIVSKL